MDEYPTDKDVQREFYPGTGVWKQELSLIINGCHAFARARDVKGGILIFVPDSKIKDFTYNA